MANLTQHFSGLSEAEQERLVILQEECAEVIKAAAKILRHGYDSDNKGQMKENNRRQLEKELGDVEHAVRRMEDAHDIEPGAIDEGAKIKAVSILPYLHHQGE